MMGTLNKVSLMALCLISSLLIHCAVACSSTVSDLTGEVQSLEDLVDNLDQAVSKIRYPQEIPFETMIPKSWYLDCNINPHDKSKLACYIGVPLPQPFPVYDISVPCGLNGTVYMKYDQNLENLVLVQGSCDNLRATHLLYPLKSPPVFPEQKKDYQLKPMVAQLIKANPYKAGDAMTAMTEFQRIVASLNEQTHLLEYDVNSAVSWADLLEKTYFLPYSWCWDTQKEVIAYRTAMSDLKPGISELKRYLDKLSQWDFAGLKK
jgi:hypothetical protein